MLVKVLSLQPLNDFCLTVLCQHSKLKFKCTVSCVLCSSKDYQWNVSNSYPLSSLLHCCVHFTNENVSKSFLGSQKKFHWRRLIQQELHTNSANHFRDHKQTLCCTRDWSKHKKKRHGDFHHKGLQMPH